jgi:hypothetical protein
VFKSVYPIDVSGGTNHFSVLTTMSAPSNRISIWQNDGNENFEEYIIDSDFANAWCAYPIDLNSDGLIDIVGAAANDDQIAWWKNDDWDFIKYIIDDAFDGARCVYPIDLDEDGDIDVLGAANLADDIVWYDNDGDENFTKKPIHENFDGAWSVFAIDLDDDNDIDVLGAAADANTICWWENDGSENFTAHIIDSTFDGARSVYAVDINGDDDIDIVGAARPAHDICWWENDGSIPPNFTKNVIDSAFNGANSVYSIDIDGDNDNDVLGAALGSGWITWWENDLGNSYDVGMVSIDMPLNVPQDTTMNPQATVKNMGTLSETFGVTCEIEPGGYLDHKGVYDLAPGDSTQVIFDDPFTFTSGSYTVTIYTNLEVDENSSNDTLEIVIETYDPGIAEGISDIPHVLTFSAPTITKKRSEITLALPQATKVTLVIYDALGRLTETVISKSFSAGNHRIAINLDLPAGIYFYNLKTAAGEAVIEKFLLVE